MAISHISGAMVGIYRNAQSRIPETISLPPKLLYMYEDFVINNASSVSQIESALRSLTYIIPGRFQEAELASETLHTSIQLLSLYHDSLLFRAFSALTHSASRPLPTPHSRYTRFFATRSPIYKRCALILQTIQYTELLWEMIAKRRGEKVRWRVVILLEVIKAVCRFVILRICGCRVGVSPPLPEREVDPRTMGEQQVELKSEEEEKAGRNILDDAPLLFDRPSSSPGSWSRSWHMPRTGLTFPSLPSAQHVTDYLLAKVLTADDIKPARRLLHRVTSNQGTIAESMYILRPVVYALAMAKWFSPSPIPKNGIRVSEKTNWAPWLIGIGWEIAARKLATRDIEINNAGGLRGISALERDELNRRGRAMGWWFMRGAFYENVTKGWIDGVSNKLRGKALLDMAAAVIDEYVYLWDEYHFSTATM